MQQEARGTPHLTSSKQMQQQATQHRYLQRQQQRAEAGALKDCLQKC